jgi:hypothetical protein
MSINFLAEIFLVVVVAVVGIIYVIDLINDNIIFNWRHSSKLFVIGLVSFGLFFFCLSFSCRMSVAPQLFRAMMVSDILGSVFIGLALFELAMSVVERFRLKL